MVIKDTLEPVWPSGGASTSRYFSTPWHMVGASEELFLLSHVVLAWGWCSVGSLMTFSFFSRPGQRTFCCSFSLVSHQLSKLWREKDVLLLLVLTGKILRLENKLFHGAKLAFSTAFYSFKGRQSLLLPTIKTCLVREVQVREPLRVRNWGTARGMEVGCGVINGESR